MEIHNIFLTLGGLFLVGLAADTIGRRTRIPRVTLLILFGFAAGQSGFDILPKDFQAFHKFLTTLALTMVAFLLGSKLSVRGLRQNGKEILAVSLTVVVTTIAIVGTGLILLGTPLLVALLLSSIAIATAPAATQDVVRQTHARGPFTDTLLGIVAIDDVWGLVIFSILLVVANAILSDGSQAILMNSLWEIGGAVAVGAVVGLPAAYLTGRVQGGEPMQAEALGLVFLCAGISLWFEVSFLLAGIVTGSIVVNLAKHHNRPFHEIEQIEWPFMVLFFVLAGAALNLSSLQNIGVIGVAYILLRLLSRVFGGWLGATIAGAPHLHRKWIGIALVPQAGVAIGMVLIAGNQLPELKEPLLALVISSTIVFELVGPILTQKALQQVGENN
jgi:Kef-type K+ transport system membrane component KefB